ncbi:chorismate mutase, partial [Escherichia coli]|nr:chorismate mutase [Escherichia coli]
DLHKPLGAINHVYLRGAKVLRPDLVKEGDA